MASPRAPSRAGRVRGGSATPVNEATIAAENTYVTASTSIASGALRSRSKVPARAGPAVCATAPAVSSRACARCSPLRSTRRGTKDWDAASLTSETAPNSRTTTSSSGKVSTSKAQASGIRPRRPALARSVATITGRRRTRSTSAPTTRPSSRYGSHRAELSQPTCVALPASVTRTRVCNASAVTAVPRPETASPHQKRPNSGERSSRVVGEVTPHTLTWATHGRRTLHPADDERVRDGGEQVRPRAEGGRGGRPAGDGEDRPRRRQAVPLQDRLHDLRREEQPRVVDPPRRRRQRLHGCDGPVDLPPAREAPRCRGAVPGVCRGSPAASPRAA